MAIGFDIKRKGKSELEIILNKHITTTQLLKRLEQYNSENQIYLDVKGSTKKVIGGKEEEAAKTTSIYFVANVEKDRVVFNCNRDNDTKKYLVGFILDYY